MKGEWVYEERVDQWHLIWNTIFRDGEPAHEAWCGFTVEVEGSQVRTGHLINGIADTVHDDCYRKSEELE